MQHYTDDLRVTKNNMDHRKIQEERVRRALDCCFHCDTGKEATAHPAIKALIEVMEHGQECTWWMLQEKAFEASRTDEDLRKEKETQDCKRSRIERMMAQTTLENQRLKEKVRSTELELAAVREQYAEHARAREKARKQEKINKAFEKETEMEYRKLRTEYILLRTEVEKLENQNDLLRKEHTRKVTDCKMTNTGKEMMLEDQITKLTKVLEQNDLGANTPEADVLCQESS